MPLNKNEEKYSEITKIWLRFLIIIFFGNDCFQNMFVYQPTFYLLGYKQVGSGYVI